jgi:hypothetical protein
MAHIVDKGHKMGYDQSDLLGQKPYGSIGPGRTAEEMKVVSKIKKKKASALRAEGSTAESGQKANGVGRPTKMKHFARY